MAEYSATARRIRSGHGADATAPVPELVPARILNEHVYCPRLGYLEWVDRRFEESADTVEKSWVHRRVDEERGRASPSPEPEGEPPPLSTAVTVGSEKLGVIAKIEHAEAYFAGTRTRHRGDH